MKNLISSIYSLYVNPGRIEHMSMDLTQAGTKLTEYSGQRMSDGTGEPDLMYAGIMGSVMVGLAIVTALSKKYSKRYPKFDY